MATRRLACDERAKAPDKTPNMATNSPSGPRPESSRSARRVRLQWSGSIHPAPWRDIDVTEVKGADDPSSYRPPSPKDARTAPKRSGPAAQRGVHHALVGAGRQQCTPLQHGRDLARTYFDRLPALRVLRDAAGGSVASTSRLMRRLARSIRICRRRGPGRRRSHYRTRCVSPLSAGPAQGIISA